MKNFKAQSISYSFNFGVISNIQQKYIRNSEILEKINFQNPMIIPNTQNMPDEMPVVIINHEEHKEIQLVISRENLSITFPYVENLEESYISYVQTICEFLNKIMDCSNIQYCGYTKRYILEDEVAIESIKNVFLKTKDDLFDVDITYTSVLDERFYVNKKIANTRIYENPVNQKIGGFLNNEYKNAMILTIDVNNRHAFNLGRKDISDLNSEISNITIIADNGFNEILNTLKGSGN